MEDREKLKLLLWKYSLSQVWLIAELKKHRITVDKSSLSDFINGRREGSTATFIISMSLLILDDYEQYFVNGTSRLDNAKTALYAHRKDRC